MTLLTAQKSSVYLAGGAALAAVALSGELPLPYVILIAALFAASYPVGERFAGKGRLIWNTIAVTAAVYLTFAVWTGLMDIVLAVTMFAMGLLIERMYSRRGAREYALLHLTMLLVISGGAVLTADISFGVAFLVFSVAATWSMTLALLRADIEEEARVNQSPDGGLSVLQSQRIVSARFMGLLAGLALAAVAAAVVVFIFFPRVSIGMWGRKGLGDARSGFSGQVELGGQGLIKDDPRVAFRVFFPTPHVQTSLGYYWRGAAMDEYDGHAWHNRLPPPHKIDDLTPLYRFRDPWEPASATLESKGTEDMTIEMIPDPETNALFTTGRLRSLEFQPRKTGTGTKLMLWGAGSDATRPLEYRPVQQSDFSYKIRTVVSAPPRLRNLGREYPKDFERYLQVPKDLNPRIAQLAKRIIGDKDPVDAVDAVVHFLQTYSYSLDMTASGPDPLASFLFDVKAGHCEYFATATAVLLRLGGVPARMVTGFYGGRYISNGGYYAVREGDAHAWVEVFYPKIGWVTVDATPPADREAHVNDLYSAMSLWVDGLRTQWRNMVVEYDLATQVRGFRNLMHIAQDFSARIGGRSKATGLQRVARMALSFGLPLIGAVLIYVLLRLRGRRVRRGRVRLAESQRRAASLYRDLSRRLARHGVVRRPSQTPNELLAEVRARKIDQARVVERVVDRYVSARFGRRPLDAAEERELRNEMRKV
jgi:transglutaminase-like putative cysteine protease